MGIVSTSTLGPHGRDLLGRVFVCEGGTVRWCYDLTARGGVYCRWLDQLTGVWHNGGTWERGRGLESLRRQIQSEAPAPQPGDTFVLMGVFGQPRTWTMPVPAAPAAPADHDIDGLGPEPSMDEVPYA